MRYAFMAAEMRELDRHTIEDLGVPGLVLMERAALAVADAAEELYAENMANAPVIAVCGTGNNGGDGAAAARILLGRGIPAEIVLIGNRESLSKDMEAQLSMAENFGVPVYSGSIRLSANAAVYIDALFGIGLGREVRGDFAAAIRIMNEAKGKVVAADIPSGISADTGQVLGTAVRADVTVTMQCGKPGLFLDPGRQYAGEVRIRDIGIWSQFCSRTDGILRFAQNDRRVDENCSKKDGILRFAQNDRRLDENCSKTDEILRFAQNDRHLEKNWLPPRPICILEKSDLSTLLPRREPSGNKGTFGKVLLIAGSENMAGAAILAARAVLASGAGMVKVLTPVCNREILQISVPEALLATYTPENVEKVLQSNLSFGNVVAIGPGLGTGPEARRLVKTVMEVSEDSVVSKDSQKSLLVLDADALNIIASENLRESLPKGAFLTPHIVEFSRISELSAKEIQADRLSAARAFAERYGVRLILKDARTVICGDGEAFINLSGNDGLATAGSGDVLTGILAGLLAQDTEPAFAGPTAAFLHGLAGDAAAEKMGRRSMNAGDVCSSLPIVLK